MTYNALDLGPPHSPAPCCGLTSGRTPPGRCLEVPPTGYTATAKSKLTQIGPCTKPCRSGAVQYQEVEFSALGHVLARPLPLLLVRGPTVPPNHAR
jgi:hypothetical protein